MGYWDYNLMPYDFESAVTNYGLKGPNYFRFSPFQDHVHKMEHFQHLITSLMIR